MTAACQSWGESPARMPIDLYRLRSRHVELCAMTYGAIVTGLTVPDRDGVPGNIVLGHATPEEYFENRAYLGAIVGRCANRIANATFELDGRRVRLEANDGPHHLHGGRRGFDRYDWRATAATDDEGARVTFTRVSADGEEGYPGRLDVSVSYALRATGVLVIEYEAGTDAPTIVNLTQHTYFNLSGDPRRDTRGHELTIDASGYTPVGAGLIPRGMVASTAETPFDFRRPAPIRARLSHPHEQLAIAGGFDHNWALDGGGRSLAHAARLYDPVSGRALDIATTEPGLQFYDGHLLERDTRGAFRPHAGLCLETQHFPDSPHYPSFPTTVLRPGETFRSTTVWRFGTDRVRDAA